MFINYTKQVLRDYGKKRAANALSPRLLNSSSAKLRWECMDVCNERYQKKDEKALRDFFGVFTDKESCAEAIYNCVTDKFKPLSNFLKKELQGGPSDKNIELLAWLINFENRPYQYGTIYADPDEEPGETPQSSKERATELYEATPEGNTPVEAPLQEGPKTETRLPPPTDIDDPSPASLQQETPASTPLPFLKRKAIIATSLVIASGISIYLGTREKPTVYARTGQEKCMYWNEDHYEPISCGLKPPSPDLPVIALDSLKLNTFKKITRPDTITSKDKGRIWYVNIKKNIEFYTSEGFHPIKQEYRLRPVTDYIISKYISGSNM
jgi:hypothetical protein